MSYAEEYLNRLNDRFNQLSLKQTYLTKELEQLQQELQAFKSNTPQLSIPASENLILPEPIPQATPVVAIQPEPIVEPLISVPPVTNPIGESKPPVSLFAPTHNPPPPPKPVSDTHWEKFLGENLINKIGIAITVIGVGIGAKYAIDHYTITPLTRLLVGYLFAVGLLGVAMKLKANYNSYSAVLLSGSLAIMYFLTYLGYGYYDGLIPQIPAFLMMVAFTGFTVFAAIQYNQQVIAIIGLVGAYFVPILLSDGSGKVHILFSYITIINCGILFLSFKKNWLPVFYTAFGLTWLILIGWFTSKYQADKHLIITLAFTSIFFITFYVTLLANRILAKQIFGPGEIVLLLANTFIHFGVCYAALSQHPQGTHFLGLFTVITAAVHFAVSLYIYKKDLADKQLYYLVSGLVLVFITLAVPVQLKGNWITVMWATEAALLLWIGRSKQAKVYEILSYPVLILALVSLVGDWMSVPGVLSLIESKIGYIAIINTDFATAAIATAAFGVMYQIDKRYPTSTIGSLASPVRSLLQMSFLTSLFFLLYIELGRIFDLFYYQSSVVIKTPDMAQQVDHIWYIMDFKGVARLVYTLLFFTVVTWFPSKYTELRKKRMGIFILNATATLLFLTYGLYTLSELRENYLLSGSENVQPGTIWGIIIRYPSLTVLALFMFVNYQYAQRIDLTRKNREWIQLSFHIILLWVLSSELLHWLDIGGSKNTYKLGLSLLWGFYSLGLIVVGIWKQRQFIRIAAFALFGFTLLKLFVYDLASLSTIAKTIVLVALGLLLLIISFLYNKYKHLISNEKS